MSRKPSDYRLGYRPDIEGLRAIAILLVVAEHAGVSWLTGGFIGVDVFFVLSGYLITALLVQEIGTTGSLDFAAFYVRRLRRLMPGLYLMLGVTFVLTWQLVSPIDQMGQADAGGSAAVWLSNFYFAFTDQGYFSPDAKSSLFLHTWSLGVEEQFYLLWPLMLVLVCGAWQGAKRPLAPSRLRFVLLVVFALSLGLCLWWAGSAPHLAFYMMPARAWQFSLGALVCMYFGTPRLPQQNVWRDRLTNSKVMLIFGWGGVGAILVAAVMIRGDTPYPSTWALLPSLGAAGVIAAGAQTWNQGVGRWLALRPMQAVGRVSYSWYLWHWPVLLIGLLVPGMQGGWQKAALVTLSLVLAVVAYRAFELPIRRIRWVVEKPYLGIGAGLALMVVATLFAIHWHDLSMQEVRTPEQARLFRAKWDIPVIYFEGCDDWDTSADVKVCSFGPSQASHTAVVVGDSVVLQWFPAIRRLFNKRGWRLLAITKSACPMVARPIFYERIGKIYTKCGQWRKLAIEKLQAVKPAAVIMGSAYSYDFTKRQWIEGTRELINSINPVTRHIYILRSTPTLPFNGLECIAPHKLLYRLLIGGRDGCSTPAYSKHFDDVYTWLESAASHYPDVSMVDMTEAVCPNALCRAKLEGKIVYRDGQHITASFAKSLAEQFDRAMQNGVKPNTSGGQLSSGP